MCAGQATPSQRRSGSFTIVVPTRLNLEKLDRQRMVGALRNARAEPIFTVGLSVSNASNGRRSIHMAHEAEYGGIVLEV